MLSRLSGASSLGPLARVWGNVARMACGPGQCAQRGLSRAATRGQQRNLVSVSRPTHPGPLAARACGDTAAEMVQMVRCAGSWQGNKSRSRRNNRNNTTKRNLRSKGRGGQQRKNNQGDGDVLDAEGGGRARRAAAAAMVANAMPKMKDRDHFILVQGGQKIPLPEAYRLLSDGVPLCFENDQRWGLIKWVYAQLKNMVGRRDAISSFEAQQDYNGKVLEVFRHLHLPVVDGAVAVARLPHQFRDLNLGDFGADCDGGNQQRTTIPIRKFFGFQNCHTWKRRGLKVRDRGDARSSVGWGDAVCVQLSEAVFNCLTAGWVMPLLNRCSTDRSTEAVWDGVMPLFERSLR
eukprot:m.465670 g.465670  ORF g.465670 m.465670 type:complete len:348 (-) comp20361_c14_seq19:27-1070(-)